MNFFRLISDLALALQSVLIASKIVRRGSSDVSFPTQAMRLLMFCTRYLDLLWIPVRLPVKLFLLLSTLAVVILLGHNYCSGQNAHRAIDPWTIGEVSTILVFSSVLGVNYMYSPTLLEFFWAFSRVLDVMVELPQLRILWFEHNLDEWFIAYYCSIGTNVFFYILDFVHRIQPYNPVFDITTLCTTSSKGAVIAIFFIHRYFKQRARRPADVQEEAPPSPDILDPIANEN